MMVDLLKVVKKFCGQHLIEIPDTDAPYRARRGMQQREMSIEEYYKVDIFFVTIDKELDELNSRFNDNSIDILNLSSTLVPKNGYKLFDIDQICRLAEKYYPADFDSQEKLILMFQLQHFIIDARSDPKLSNLSTISELSASLAETEKASEYFLVDRLIRLVLTLPMSTTTTERAFYSMKIVKMRLYNKTEDEFLSDSLVMYIKKHIVQEFDTDSIIDYFKNMKIRRVKF